jgi:hypothetical protein
VARERQALVLVWGLAVLAAVVALALAGAPIPVVLALIACLPRRVEVESPRGRPDADAEDETGGP